MKYRIKKLILSFLIAAFIFSTINFSATASSSNLSEQKKDAYLALAKIIYDNNNNILYRMQTLEEMANLEGLNFDFSVNHFQNFISKDNKTQTVNNNIDSKIQYLIDKNYMFGYLLKELSQSNEPAIKEFSKSLLKNLDKNEALQVFTEMTKSNNNEEKIIGIKGLAKINSPESTYILLGMLNKASINENLLITDILSSSKDIQVLDTARNMLKSEKDPKIIINLAIILINNGDNTYLKFIQDYCFSKNIEYLRYLALKLKDIKGNIDFSIIENLSSHSDATIKIGIISFFEQYKNNIKIKSQNDHIIKILKRYVFDESDLISLAALKILASFPDKKINAIIKPLIYDKHFSLPTINIILSTNNRYLLPSIYELTKLDNDQIKIQSAKCLINYGKNPKKVLKNLANKSKTIDIRLSASILLYKISGSTKYLENITKDYDESTKEAKDIAVLYLANSKYKNITLEDLKTIAFDNSSKNNGLTAALLLYNNNNDSGFDVLRKFLSSRKPVIITDKFPIENILTALLEDKNNWVKVNSAYNLARMQNKKGLDVLKTLLLSTDDSKIRASAAIMLGNTGSPNDIDILKLAYNDKFCRVRSSAAQAVIEIISRYEQANNTKNIEINIK
ncbi:MAG: HEAT repeat domain-containing protein [Candidatus Gastranaerophilales bacterium]|nr:HEAT repeat domain-containing protein [Candidatus Gastranaerophilales bacterium]